MASAAGAGRSDAYATAVASDAIEDLSKKLTVDLRKHIRALGPYPVLSDKWMHMADSLQRIANVSAMERSLPKDKDDASLWECEELALRYLLEDGKLNLCLRLLEEYTEVAAEVTSGKKKVTTAHQEQMTKFEKGIGVLLANAWMHAEALQTTDLPLLCKHTSNVMATAAETDFKANLEGLQPAVALHYLLALGKHLDDVDETRVLPVLLEHHCIKNTIRHLERNYKMLTEADQRVGAVALALLADSEEFLTHPDAFLEDDETRKSLVELKTLFVSNFTKDAPSRKELRPLTDLMDRSQAKLSK